MSAAERKAVLQEALDQSFIYRAFATIRNGLPNAPTRNVIGDMPEPPPIPSLPEKKNTVSVSSETVRTNNSIAPSLGSRIAAGLVGASLLAGGTAAGGLATWLASSGADKPPAVTPTDPPPQYGDLLMWLDQEGYNLPPAEGPNP